MKEMPSSAVTFVHIEKTAGTSTRQFIENAVGSEHVGIYHATEDRISLSIDRLHPTTDPTVDALINRLSHPSLSPLLSALSPLLGGVNRLRVLHKYPEFIIPDGTRVIFGHFSADRFDKLIDRQIRAVVLREPLERMTSHYDHWRRNRGVQNWRVKIPYDARLGFETFAFLPQLQNYQSQALAGISLSDFDVAGTTENLASFTERLANIFLEEEMCAESTNLDIALGKLNRTHEKRAKPTILKSDSFRNAFREFHSVDYDLYQEAVEIN